MFGLRQQLRLKQAQNALSDGRIDEAFAIAIEKDIRELRGGQSLLTQLVAPLLDRAEKHLEKGRLKDALLDVERAIQAGGNGPRAAGLRAQVHERLEARERMVLRGRDLIESARGHLERGSLRTGKAILEQASGADQGAAALKERLERREGRAAEAMRRAEAFLDQAAVEEALDAAREALEAHPRGEGLADLLLRLRKAALSEAERAFAGGQLSLAAGLLDRARPLFNGHLEFRALDDGLAMAQRAAAAVAARDFEAARIALGRLAKLVPAAGWIEAHLDDLESLAGALRRLKTGPLGLLGSGGDAPAGAGEAAATVAAAPRPAVEAAAPFAGHRMLLWVDGIGTYLVLAAPRIAIGRSGSSARPDIALAADLEGHHAEILRVEDDYFIVAAQGQVRAGGKEVQRKLLADGERLELGKACEIAFRMPTALSATAVLTLHRGQRIERDVREVILLDRDLLIGAAPSCHVRVAGQRRPVVLSRSQGVLRCRAEEDILVDGKSSGIEALVAPGAHVQIGSLSFTVTVAEIGPARVS